MKFRKCGNSGLKLPVISLGLWHNFGAGDVYSNSEAVFKKLLSVESHTLILQIIMVDHTMGQQKKQWERFK